MTDSKDDLRRQVFEYRMLGYSLKDTAEKFSLNATTTRIYFDKHSRSIGIQDKDLFNFSQGDHYIYRLLIKIGYEVGSVYIGDNQGLSYSEISYIRRIFRYSPSPIHSEYQTILVQFRKGVSIGSIVVTTGKSLSYIKSILARQLKDDIDIVDEKLFNLCNEDYIVYDYLFRNGITTAVKFLSYTYQDLDTYAMSSGKYKDITMNFIREFRKEDPVKSREYIVSILSDRLNKLDNDVLDKLMLSLN